jgi:hypothetical protein
MPADKLVLLRSDNGVILSKVTLALGKWLSEMAGVTSYAVESNRTPDVKASATRADDAPEHYEEEVERCRLP